MKPRKPKTGFHLRPPTLRVDSQRAWRQSEDAIILPIVYELAEPAGRSLQPDSTIVSIPWPMKMPARRHKASIISLGIPTNEEDRKKKLALLKKKVESAKARVLKSRKPQASQTEPAVDAALPNASPESSHAVTANPNSIGNSAYFATAVQLLLLSVIALVVFAWVCFR
ncbi:MAG: hypothetical protein JNK38_15070 [Acidobacteria bacterium]|nr:hypothetical protein [Acidobacteriota bacterium]